jgi:hypothetical protein
VDTADRQTAWEFHEQLIKAVTYRPRTILTDNDIQVAGQPHTHRADYMDEYIFARRLKELNGFTPCEYICKIRTSEPD